MRDLIGAHEGELKLGAGICSAGMVAIKEEPGDKSGEGGGGAVAYSV